jgi:thiol-disulfide isomerase/thioredoxin
MRKINFLVLLGFLVSFMVTTSSVAKLSGEMSPDCTLTAFNGSPVNNLQALQGEVVYLDFWASWCIPCIRSFPFMNQLEHDLKDKGLRVVGVNLDEDPADARKFLEKYPVDFSIVTDPEKQCVQDFNVFAMPSAYLIDRKGVVRHVHQGFRAEETQELRLLIEELLAESL